VSAMSGGGDRGSPFPQSDADDLGRGARYIPGEVTLARRDGRTVRFEQPDDSDPKTWFWLFDDDTRIHMECGGAA
jgi:hypothetical protein